MGFCMHQVENEFFIAAGDREAALAEIKKLDPYTHDAGGGSSSGEKWFSWVDTNEYLEAVTLAGAMRAWRWEIEEDAEGNVVDVCFAGEKLGDDETLLAALAPFVREGSYIQMQGEDDSMWRWVFDGTSIEEVCPAIIWP